jgi:hypothetical protein
MIRDRHNYDIHGPIETAPAEAAGTGAAEESGGSQESHPTEPGSSP